MNARTWLVMACISIGLPLASHAGSELARPPERFMSGARGILNRYLVVLRQDIATANGVERLAAILERRYGGVAKERWENSLKGFVIDLPESAARVLALEPWVEWVEQDQIVELSSGTQSSPTWGLDRIDQGPLPLSQSYYYPVSASGVNVYVIDTGIYDAHPEFGGRVVGDFTAINDGYGAGDCNGHGTHVAGTVGSASYGVAKRAKLHSVRVLDCAGYGYLSAIVSGVDWVTASHVKPAVANMSLYVPNGSATLDAAVQGSIDAGVTYVVAAANSSHDACLDSPGRVGAAITVGASTVSDSTASFSNFGSCVDLYAPGVDILSTWNNGGTNTLMGTSMASPHVAGTAAMYLAWKGAALPSEVANQIIANASANRLTGVPAGSPNRLLYSPFMPACDAGLEMCGGTCTSLLTDPVNCKECGRRCTGSGRKCFPGDGTWYYAGQTCSNGGCVSRPCE